MKHPQKFSSLTKEICYFRSEGLIWKGRVEVDWDAADTILHRGSLKARYQVLVSRASSEGQVFKYSL